MLPPSSYSLVQMTLFLCLMVNNVQGQRRVIGDNKEQRISQLAEVDVREERVYR